MSLRLVLIAGAFVLTGAADAPQLTALSHIEPGQWALKANSPGASPRNLCIADPRVLLQLQHSGVACSRFVIANNPNETTVHYTCPGAGHGRTTIKVETPRLIHIDSQGIAGNAPFEWSIEARKTGNCATTATR